MFTYEHILFTSIYEHVEHYLHFIYEEISPTKWGNYGASITEMKLRNIEKAIGLTVDYDPDIKIIRWYKFKQNYDIW